MKILTMKEVESRLTFHLVVNFEGATCGVTDVTV
jgi:hypothetical protein